MRTREQRLERLVCAEHCRFFKPWQKETSRCGAYRWLLTRSLRADHLLDAVERLRGERLATVTEHDPVLLRSVCHRCDYFPAGCAYRDPSRAGGATRCGALAVLHALLDRGHLSLEELYAPLDAREPCGAGEETLQADP